MHVVTGASSGIGRGVVIALAKRDQEVLAVARSGKLLSDLAAAIPDPIRTLRADVSTEPGRAAVVDSVAASRVRSLTHAAASVIQPEPWSDLNSVELLDHLSIHVVAPIVLSSRLLRSTSIDRIAFIDSYAATTPRDGWSAYSIAKAAAQMSARAAARELADTSVARFFPGAVDTPVLRAVIDSAAPAAGGYRALVADGKVSDPLIVGNAIAEILLDTPDEVFSTTEVWTVGHPA